MERGSNFDGLRLIGALMVLFSHQFPLTGRPELILPVIVSFGHAGVLLFFVISGNLVAQSWLRDPNVARFAMRRVLRLWPALALVTLFGTVLLLPLAASPLRALPALWFDTSNVIAFPLHPHPYLNGSLWTIPIELGCYVCLVVAGLIARECSVPLRTVLLAAAATWIVLTSSWPFLPGADLLQRWNANVLLEFSAFFLAGALLCAWPPIHVGIAGPVVAAAGQPLLGGALIAASVIVWVGNRSWPLLRAAGRFGDLSYGIYIWAWPIQQLVVQTLPRGTNFGISLAATLAFTIPAAWLSWHLVEAPALRLKPMRPTARQRASLVTEAA